MRDTQIRHRSVRVTALALAALLLAPTGALAASPEDDYIAARDSDIAELKTLEAPEDWPKHKVLQEKDTKDLEQRLKAMVGPFALAGFPAQSRLNADLYAGDPSFGEIDGLVYYDGDSDSGRYDGVDAVIVTTDGLLNKWLLGHPKRWSKVEVPHAAAVAVGTEAFYTQGLTRQGDVVRFGTIPIVAPPGAKFARAMLATIDAGPDLPSTPDGLYLALEKGGRVFIVSVRPTTTIKNIAACDAALAINKRKDELNDTAMNKAINNLKLQNRLEKLGDKIRAQGRAAFLSCFNDKITTTREFEAARKQAAAIVEALAKN
jgi:hypothetical protein